MESLGSHVQQLLDRLDHLSMDEESPVLVQAPDLGNRLYEVSEVRKDLEYTDGIPV
jgi:hypothetical protein